MSSHLFDLRTLLLSHVVLCLASAGAFLATARINRGISGIRTLGLSFLVCAPGTLLIVLRGSVSLAASVILGNGIIFAAHVLMTAGISELLQVRRRALPLLLMAMGCDLLLAYFVLVREDIVARIFVIGVFGALLRGVMVWDLFRTSPRSSLRTTFAAALVPFILLSLERPFATLAFSKVHADFFHMDSYIQSFSMLSNLLYIALSGVFCLALVGERVAASIEFAACRDTLTKVLNRKGIVERFHLQFSRAFTQAIPLCILLVDLDHFKSINDTLGHAAGDDALSRVADLLAQSIRQRDDLGRLGGDEFLLVLPNVGISLALGIAQRICETASSAVISGKALSVSIGAAVATLQDTPTTLLARADEALYEAKRAGRGCARMSSSPEVPELPESVELGLSVCEEVPAT